jgi:hypothetical protein
MPANPDVDIVVLQLLSGIPLLLVPVFYSIFVLDLKWIKWETAGDREQACRLPPLSR